MSACIERHGDAQGKQPVFVYKCDELRPIAGAPEVGSLAVLVVHADQGRRFVPGPGEEFDPHPNGGEAAFLITSRAGGFCLAAQLVDWDWDQIGTIDNRYEASARPVGGRTELHVHAEHVSRMELDQDELAQGESDVRYSSCTTVSYALEAGRFVQLHKREVEGVCP